MAGAGAGRPLRGDGRDRGPAARALVHARLLRRAARSRGRATAACSCRTPAEGYARGCEAVAAWDFRERLGAIRAPTLVVVGEDDPATPPEHGSFLSERIAGAALAVLPAAAHLANVQQPESFAALVTRHVALQEVA